MCHRYFDRIVFRSVDMHRAQFHTVESRRSGQRVVFAVFDVAALDLPPLRLPAALLALPPSAFLSVLSPTALELTLPNVSSYDIGFAETLSLTLPGVSWASG